jgi:hypothetical protein
MGDYIQAWQCIGCGKIEAPQTCIGVCRDRKIMLVGIEDHQQALDEVQRLYGQLEQAQSMLARMARTTPREGHWREAWKATQEQARRILAEWSAHDAATTG